MVWLEKLWWRLWITVGAVGGLGFGLCGALLLFSQTMTWLKTAYWPPHTILDALLFMGMPVPYIQNWAGIQTIADDVLQWPQVLGHHVFGSIFLLI